MFRQHRGNVIAGVVALELLFAGTLTAAPPERDEVERLAIQLRAPEFADRRAAETALENAGAHVTPLLESIAENASPEVRVRLQRVIDHLRQQQLEEALAALEAGERTLTDHLPGWSRFATQVGDDAAAARWYADMVRAEPQLFGAIEAEAEEPQLQFERRCAELLQSRRKPMDEIRVATIASLLFMGTAPDCLPSPASGACVNSLVQSRGFEEAMQDDEQSPLRTLTVAWVLRPESSTAVQRLSLAARYNLPEGVDVAREIIASRIYGQQIRSAILFLAKHGRADAIADLEELLEDDTELRVSTRSRSKTFTSLVRDVALAGLLHLTDQDPRQYGFPELRENREYLFVAQDIGFRDPKARDAAFERWRRWQAQNLRRVQPRPTQAVEGIAL